MLFCFLLNIKSTYLAVVTQMRENKSIVLGYKEVLEKYRSQTDGFSTIDTSFQELIDTAEQVAFGSVSTTVRKFVQRHDRASHYDVSFALPITTSPAYARETPYAATEKIQLKPGGKDCTDNSECESGICRELDLQCDDNVISYDLFLTFADNNLASLKDLIDGQIVSITDALIRVLTNIECNRVEGQICLDQLLDEVRFQGSYEPISGFFDDDLFLEKSITLDNCSISSLSNGSTKSSFYSISQLSRNSTSNPTLSPSRPQFLYILFFQIISRCYGCRKGNFFLAPDGSRRRLLTGRNLIDIEFCDADDQEPVLRGVVKKNDFESSLDTELEPEVASRLVDANEEQEWTLEPSIAPSSVPSTTPSEFPSISPSNKPSETPSTNPSRNPSAYPSGSPTGSPTRLPTPRPTYPNPTASISSSPSDVPSVSPSVSNSPSVSTSPSVSDSPSVHPKTA
mmetsp:Transcript_24036/g.36534  ORF Transcript_24036/g.36534 Transcript_24036/m.36534 type:complete len:455 (-) Transcript_24036:297-1661(-)